MLQRLVLTLSVTAAALLASVAAGHTDGAGPRTAQADGDRPRVVIVVNPGAQTGTNRLHDPTDTSWGG